MKYVDVNNFPYISFTVDLISPNTNSTLGNLHFAENSYQAALKFDHYAWRSKILAEKFLSYVIV